MGFLQKWISLINKSARIRFYISYLIIFSIPIIIIGIIVQAIMGRIIIEQVERTYANNLHELQKSMEREFSDLGRFTVQLSQKKWVKSLYSSSEWNMGFADKDPITFNAYKEELSLYRNTNSFIDEIALNIEGKDFVIYSTSVSDIDFFFENTMKLKGIAARSWWGILKQYNYNNIIAPVKYCTFESEKKGCIFISSIPIIYREYYGTVIAFISEDRIKEKIRELFNDDGFSVSLYNSKYELITGVNNLDYDIAGYLKRNRDGDENFFIKTISINGNRRILFHLISGDYGWHCTVTVPKALLMSRIYRMRMYVVLVILALFILGLPFIYWIVEKNYLPINRLLSLFKSSALIEDVRSPVNEYDMLQKAINGVFKENSNLEEQLKFYKPLLANSYLLKIINGEVVADAELMKILSFLNINMPYKYFTVFCFFLHDEYDTRLISDITADIFPGDDTCCHSVNINSKSKAVIINFMGFDSIKNLIINCKRNLENNLGANISIGVGGIYDDINRLADLYNEALKAYSYRFTEKKGSIIWFSEVWKGKSTFCYPIDSEKCLYNHLRTGNLKGALENFSEIFDKNLQDGITNPDILKCLISNIFATVLKVVDETKLYDISLDFNMVLSLEDIDEVREFFKTVFEQVCSAFDEEKNNKDNIFKSNIIKWLSENFSDCNLSLTYVNEKFNVSTSYIRKLVKEQCGHSFVDYINRKRVEESKRLLKMTTLSVSDIAGKVGYNNDTTYRRLFIKYEGITPVEFRKNT